jgi:hypothetical protein
MTQRWTNPTLRAYLGEHGFLQDGETARANYGVMPAFYSAFVRGNDKLTLVEFEDGSGRAPLVLQNGRFVDVSNIGYRNEQLQHDKLKGD